MATTNTDHTDLNAALKGGVVREDVMDKIWLLDKFPLPFTDMCSTGTHGNQYVEYTTDELGAAATDNAVVDGADISQNDAVLGKRVGNYTQTAVKSVQISTRANASNSIGRQGSLSYQIMRAQQRLRRDVEAQMLTHQASVAGDGNTVAGVSAGLGAWLETNVSVGATGSTGGFNTTTGLIDAPTPGTARALTETLIRDIAQSVYENGGESIYLMGTPTVIRRLSEYLFSSSARIATMTNDNASGTSPMTAYGSANVFVTDFGQILTLVSNRMQPQDDTDVSTLYFLDPKHLKQSFMRGYRTEPLAKTGLSEKRLISVDYSLCVLNEKSQGAIMAIDETAPVEA
jgi:hypothetical protein